VNGVDPIVVEAVSSLDREVFEKNPDLTEFVRPMAVGEMPIPARDVPRQVVRVVRLFEGGRARQSRHGSAAQSIREAFERAVAAKVAELLTSRRESTS
jgi:hypothetical protein